MGLICVIGPNPAIDYTLEVPNFAPGEVNRTGSTFRMAGGKPLNVTRTISRLGGSALLALPLGGEGARLIGEAASELGIRLCVTPIAGQTRTAVIIADTANLAYSVINERGPQLSPNEAAGYEATATATIPLAAIVVASGSLPPGLPADFYARLARAAREQGRRFIVDASGQPLLQALQARPWAVKINRDELQECTGTIDPLQGTRDLLGRGLEHVIVTLGDQGAVYVGAAGQLRVSAAPIQLVNSVAAGDAFLGGLTVGLERGDSWAEALRLAAAVAGLAASKVGPDVGPNPEIRPLLERVQMSPL
jgi:1-phosphofructokinase family hexose kinase